MNDYLYVKTPYVHAIIDKIFRVLTSLFDRL